MRAVFAACFFAATLSLQAMAQDTDAMAAMAERDALCAKAEEGSACEMAKGRVVALVANAIAEAGQTKDRGAFIDLVRPYLGSDAPELRAAAAYALAKLAPDATDTPNLVSLLRDPASAVRDGAWAAAAASSDPLAQRVVDRFPRRVERNGYWPDADPFDAQSLGFSLPDGVEYLWLSAPLRAEGELQFLSDQTPDAMISTLSRLAGQPPVALQDIWSRWPEASGNLTRFGDEALYGTVQVVPMLDAAMPSPTHFVVVYEDLLFQQTGLAVIVADGRDLAPMPVPTPEPTEDPDIPLDDPAAFDAALMAAAGVRPEAPVEETDLFLAIMAAGGAEAEVYLELYPNGAYAADLQAVIAAPRLVLDRNRYPETAMVMVTLMNLPEGSMADLLVSGPTGEVAIAPMQDPSEGPVSIDISGRVVPGVYRVKAYVSLPDSDQPLALWRDFSVEQAVAELQVAKSEFAPGEMIEVTFSGMSGSDQDYVATVAAGAPLSSFVAYTYTGGARDGRLTLPAPMEPGSYELRAFFNEDESVLRASLPITVAGAAASPQPESAPIPTDTTGDDGARASIALDQQGYAPGATITVTYSGMSGAEGDYVSTAPAGSANSVYLQYAYTNRATEGTATLTAPSEPGAYEVRAFYREDETVLRGSVPFVVEGTASAAAVAVGPPADTARAELTLDAETYAPGATITVTYSGMSGGQDDYVSTAPEGASNATYLQYSYVKGVLAGTATLPAPAEPGRYEVRAFFREDETILRGSVAFVVE